MSGTTPSNAERGRRGVAPAGNYPSEVDRENEPLLGRPGDVVMGEDQGLAYNWIQGTAPLAQVGGLVLVIVVWASVLTHHKIVFDGHPMLNSLAILFAIEAILVLQPTGMYNMVQKKKAAYVHAIFVALAAVSFLSALSIVLWHKQHFHIPHLESVHSRFGAATYVLVILQALVGFTQLFVPQLYGGEENAKKIYKYHRTFGYVIILPMLLITVVLATRTEYGGHVLRIKTWAIVLAGVAIVAGVYPRIKLSKLRGHRAGAADAPHHQWR